MAEPKVVVVGAGFAGLNLARALRKDPVEVILIDRNNYHTFQPLLYQVATAGLEPEEIAHAVRGIFHGQENLSFRLGTVVNIDFEARRLRFEDGFQTEYDHLVLATGTTTNYFGVGGAEAHGFPLKSLEDAVALRAHVIRQFELADRNPELVDEGVLNFVVVGGGPTGVETAGALAELFRRVLKKDFPRLPVYQSRVILLESLSELLGVFHEKGRRHARRTLERRGVEVRTGATVVRVEPERVFLGDGTEIRNRTLIWAAGVRSNGLADRLGVHRIRGGRIKVEGNLSIPGHPNVFVVGDLAGALGEDGEPLPQLAPVAIQQGRYVARAIRNRLQGRSIDPFRYRDRGIMATVGRNAAVADLAGGVRARGFLAWLMWLFLHLVMLIGFRNRLNVLVNWAWNYFTYDRSARLIFDYEARRKESVGGMRGPARIEADDVRAGR